VEIKIGNALTESGISWEPVVRSLLNGPPRAHGKEWISFLVWCDVTRALVVRDMLVSCERGMRCIQTRWYRDL